MRARVEFRFTSSYLCLQNKHCATMCNKRAASNRIYVCVFRRQPLDNHRQDYMLTHYLSYAENVPVGDPSNKDKQDRAS